MIKKAFGAALALAVTIASSSVCSQTADGDVLFGSQTVGLVQDRDVIAIGPELGKFERIRFRVADNDIFVNDVKVVYEDGASTDVPVAEQIKRNTRTKWFSIKGDKFIKEIRLSYRAKGKSGKGQARIDVFGDYAQGWLGAAGEGRKYNQGWVLLGADAAGFVGFETRTFSVGKNEGGFRNLRVTARNRDITLRNVTVVYADGKEDVFKVGQKVELDKSYGPIDLKGKLARIKEVKGTYRSRFFSSGKGNARVEIWGQH